MSLILSDNHTSRTYSAGRINHLTLLNLIRALSYGTASIADLAVETGMNKGTIERFCRLACREGMAHISMFEKDSRGRDAIKIYKWGKGSDAVRIAKSGADRSAAYRRKLKQQEINKLMAGTTGDNHG